MSEGKRYYWLKLQDGFFTSKRIKKLRKMAGGDTYTIIYLKMQLLAMKTDGVLTFTGLESEFAEELALDLDEQADDVRVTLAYLLSCGLCETSDNISFLFPWALANTGSETASTQRSRECRARKALQCNTDATLLQQKCNVEIEKEIEIDIESEQEIEGCGGKGKTASANLDFSTGFPQVYQQPSESGFEAMREAALRKLEGAR